MGDMTRKRRRRLDNLLHELSRLEATEPQTRRQELRKERRINRIRSKELPKAERNAKERW